MMNIGGLTGSTLASFLVTALVIELTPGPNMTYLALVSATDGRRAGFMTVAGVTLGLAIIGAIAAFGVAEAIQASDVLYGLLRWAGVLFLLYLAWDGWKSSAVTTATEGEGRYFARGLITNLLNPKAGVFYVSFLPQFVPQHVAAAPFMLLLGCIHASMGVPWFGLIIGATRPISGALQQAQVVRWLDRLTGGVFLGFGVRLAMERR
jgi:threonine/homoserine/homoserine lactone efflux protein